MPGGRGQNQTAVTFKPDQPRNAGPVRPSEPVPPVMTSPSILSYPSDLALRYQHFMQITILKQSQSGYSDGTLTRGGYDWSEATSAGGIGKTTTDLTSAMAVGGAAVAGQINDTAVKVVGTGTAATIAGSLNVTRKAVKVVAYIQLYMPDTMQIDLKHDYDKLSVTDTLGTAGLMSNATEGTGEVSGTLAAKSDTMGDAKDVTNLSLMSNGYAMNPQLEILYKGPQNRQFRYTFRFTPRNQEESIEVQNLITTLRFHACPEYSSSKSSRYFIPPSEFRISHMYGDGYYNESLPRIGQCVLEEVNVNYAASGHYAAFVDGRPTEMQMDLVFTEVNILTKADIKAGF